MLAFLRLLLLCGLIGLGYAYSSERAAHEADNAAHARVIAHFTDAAKKAEQDAKAAEAQAVSERESADAKYDRAKNEADDARRNLASALRAGTMRLQDKWACTMPIPAEGDAATDAGQADAAGQYDSAARIVAAADADAAVIDWLWDGWQADRRAVVAAGCAVDGK